MAVVVVAEEAATAGALTAWLTRGVQLGGVLAGLLFGGRSREPTTNNSIGPLAGFLQAPAKVMHDMFDLLSKTLATTYNTISAQATLSRNRYSANTHYAQSLYNRAVKTAQVQATAAKQYAQGLYNRAIHEAQVQGTAAKQYAQSLYNQAIQHANQVQAYSTAYTDQSRVHVEHYAQSLYNQGVAQTQATGAAAKVYADTVSTQAAARSTAKLSSDAGSAIHPAYTGMAADLAAAAGVFGTGQPGITSLIKNVPTEAPASLPEAEAGMGSILRVLTKSLSDCIAPNCKNTSKIGKDLQDLFGVVEDAAFLAYLVAMITDPEDTARDTVTVLDPVFTATRDGVETLVGAF